MSLARAVRANRGVRRVVTIMPAITAALLAASVALGGSALEIGGGIVAGFLIATLIDYVLHRWWFHTGPHSARAEALTLRVSKLHLDHHGIPAHPKGAVNQPKATVSLAAIGLGLALLMPWPVPFAFAVVAGGTLGALAQDLTHYGTHHLPMRGPLLGLLKRHHMLHHYRDDSVNFSTFFPLWDIVFGTYWDGRARASETAKASERG